MDNEDDSNAMTQEEQFLEDIAIECWPVLNKAQYNMLLMKFGISQPSWATMEEGQ